MVAQKVVAACCGLKPLRSAFNGVVEGGEHPCRPPLEPDRLVGVNDRAIPVEGCHDPPVHGINPVPEPEGYDVVQEGALIGLSERQIIRMNGRRSARPMLGRIGVHWCFLVLARVSSSESFRRTLAT